jgi:hypothetical protein
MDYVPSIKGVFERDKFWERESPEFGRMDKFKDIWEQEIALQDNLNEFGQSLPQASPVLGANILAECLQEAAYTDKPIGSIVAETEEKIKRAID